MRPIYFTYTSVAAGGFTGPPVPLDQYISPGNVGVTISLTSGTSATVVLQYTTDNVLDPAVSTYVWQPFTATPFNTAGTYTFSGLGAIEGMFTFAPKAIRVLCTVAAGSPTINVQVIQAGIGGT